MFIPKKYGQSKVDSCPFCQKQAIMLNKQSVPVCIDHKEDLLDDLKCVCGETLDILKGKFGVFFKCIKCGNMNLRKVMEFNTIKAKGNFKNNSYQKNNYENSSSDKSENPAKNFNKTKTEITIRSDDPRYFD